MPARASSEAAIPLAVPETVQVVSASPIAFVPPSPTVVPGSDRDHEVLTSHDPDHHNPDPDHHNPGPDHHNPDPDHHNPDHGPPDPDIHILSGDQSVSVASVDTPRDGQEAALPGPPDMPPLLISRHRALEIPITVVTLKPRLKYKVHPLRRALRLNGRDLFESPRVTVFSPGTGWGPVPIAMPPSPLALSPLSFPLPFGMAPFLSRVLPALAREADAATVSLPPPLPPPVPAPVTERVEIRVTSSADSDSPFNWPFVRGHARSPAAQRRDDREEAEANAAAAAARLLPLGVTHILRELSPAQSPTQSPSQPQPSPSQSADTDQWAFDSSAAAAAPFPLLAIAAPADLSRAAPLRPTGPQPPDGDGDGDGEGEGDIGVELRELPMSVPMSVPMPMPMPMPVPAFAYGYATSRPQPLVAPVEPLVAPVEPLVAPVELIRLRGRSEPLGVSADAAGLRDPFEPMPLLPLPSAQPQEPTREPRQEQEREQRQLQEQRQELEPREQEREPRQEQEEREQREQAREQREQEGARESEWDSDDAPVDVSVAASELAALDAAMIRAAEDALVARRLSGLATAAQLPQLEHIETDEESRRQLNQPDQLERAEARARARAGDAAVSQTVPEPPTAPSPFGDRQGAGQTQRNLNADRLYMWPRTARSAPSQSAEADEWRDGDGDWRVGGAVADLGGMESSALLFTRQMQRQRQLDNAAEAEGADRMRMRMTVQTPALPALPQFEEREGGGGGDGERRSHDEVYTFKATDADRDKDVDPELLLAVMISRDAHSDADAADAAAATPLPTLGLGVGRGLGPVGLGGGGGGDLTTPRPYLPTDTRVSAPAA